MKRVIALAVSTVVLASLTFAMPETASAAVDATPCPSNGVIANDFLAGTGTAQDPYLIVNQANLVKIATNNAYLGCNFKQIADIALTGTFAPIGGSFSGVTEYAFRGTYDGDHHAITGLNVTNGRRGSGDQYAGLFGLTVGATVKNLSLSGTVTKSTGFDFGGLVGVARTTTIDSVEVAVDVTGSNTLGGLIGRATGGTISKSSSAGNITGETGISSQYGGSIGGLIGYADASSDAVLIENSFSNSAVSGGGLSSGIAGLVGKFMPGYSYVTVSKSYAVGPIVGGTQSYVPIGCGYMCMSVYGTQGGLVAPNAPPNNTYVSPFTAATSFWDLQTTGVATSAQGATVATTGTGKSTNDMKSFSTFNTASWDIANGYNASKTWGICSSVNNGYPFLSAFYAFNPCLSPQLTNVDPANGTTAGGTTVHINGADLDNTVSVKFGGVNAASFTVTGTQITAVTPAGTAGAVDVVVRDGLGVDRTLSSAFTYEEPPAPAPAAPSVVDGDDESSAEPTPASTPASTETPSPETADVPSATSISPIIDTTSGQSMKTHQILNSIVESMPSQIADTGRTLLIKKLDEGVTANVRFISPAYLTATGEVTMNRAIITKSGRVSVIIRSAPVNVLVTVKAPSTKGKKMVSARKLYRVR